MTAQNKTTIKSYFETGDKPTQSQFVDLIDSYVNTIGGAMTGDLQLPAVPVSALSATNKQYVDATVSSAVAAISLSSAAITSGTITGTVINNSTIGATTPSTGNFTTGSFTRVSANSANISGIVSAATLKSTAQITDSVTFPAGGNTALNWYEEGTFTPFLLGLSTAGTGVGYVVQTASFVRIGKVVQFSARLQLNSLGSPAMAGQLAMGGLPYTASSTISSSVSGGELDNAAANTYSMIFTVQTGTTQVWISKQASTGTAAFSSTTDITSTLRMWISGTYLL